LVDEISLAIAIAALVVSIGAIIPLYLDYFARRAEKRRIDLEVERFGEITPFPIDSNWTVRIHSPRKMIEHCSVVIEWGSGLKVLLPIGSINIHETKIPVGGSANFREWRSYFQHLNDLLTFGRFLYMRDIERTAWYDSIKGSLTESRFSKNRFEQSG
jgi:hypothetical protein